MNAVPPVLREQRGFRWLWTSQTVSLLGDQVTLVALPLAGILALHVSAFQMGILTAAGWLPYLLLSLHVGAWVDRQRRRRRLLIAADVGRALIVASVPAAWALGVLTLSQLYAVAFATGTLSVVFSMAGNAVFPALVPRDRYIAASSLLQGSRAFSMLAGPSLGGVLVQLLSAPTALLTDAVSFVVSALAIGRMPADDAMPEPVGRGHLVAGARFLLADPMVRACLAATATLNIGTFAAGAITILYLTTELHLAPSLLGVVLAAAAVGGLAGSTLAPAVADRIGIGPALTIGCAMYPAALLLIPAASGPAWLVLALLLAGEAGAGFGVMLLDVPINGVLLARVPGRLRARVTGAYTTVNYGLRPLGAVLGGALGSALGLRPTLWLALAFAILGALWLVPSPALRLRRLPDAAG